MVSHHHGFTIFSGRRLTEEQAKEVLSEVWRGYEWKTIVARSNVRTLSREGQAVNAPLAVSETTSYDVPVAETPTGR